MTPVLLWLFAVFCLLFGFWMGKSWGSLPALRIGGLVKFKGEEIGTEVHCQIEHISYDAHDGLSVSLHSKTEKVKR